MDNPQQVRDLLLQNGLADKGDAMMAVLRPSVRVFTQPADDATLPVGEPDLPPDFVWPLWEHEPSDDLKKMWKKARLDLANTLRPLAFVAQFNLAEVAPYDIEHRLPSSGMLYFFYDGVEMPDWESTRDGGARVFYHAGTDVSRTPAPDNLPRLSQKAISFYSNWQLTTTRA